MTGAFRVSLKSTGEVLSPYGFIDPPTRRARLCAAIADRLPLD